MKKVKVIFLDRDGTINEEVKYLSKTNDLKFIDGTIQALEIFADLNYIVIVITNQSGVARGYFSERDVVNLHKFIDLQLLSMSHIKGVKLIHSFYYCPHHPDGVLEKYSIKCKCRKPGPNLINKAIKDLEELGLKVDLSQSYMIGDKEIDIEAGINAFIQNNILVRSGHEIEENNTKASKIFNNLYEFALNLKE